MGLKPTTDTLRVRRTAHCATVVKHICFVFEINPIPEYHVRGLYFQALSSNQSEKLFVLKVSVTFDLNINRGRLLVIITDFNNM